ncbi:hypothetical protein FOL47_002320 [Perkinsus chesapeaki]|uniref:Uncharacterized protein n=1 Tax=Perkinsus chesapeaki TaxID=330153 RepID=A0A7J6ME76_PERCH|nr:hypothetical protein FOL47_002320 [Perkinsus chesapeaki]
MSTAPRMFSIDNAVYASSTAARKMAIKNGTFALEGDTEKAIRLLDEGKCQAVRIAARSAAGLDIDKSNAEDMKFREPLPPPQPVDPNDLLWTPSKLKATIKQAMDQRIRLDDHGPGLPPDRMFHGELKRHFEDLTRLCKDELNRLLKYTVYTTALNNLGDNPEVELAIVKNIKVALNSMLGRLYDYSKVIIDRSLDTLPPAGTSLETEVFKSRLLSIQLDTCVKSHETLQSKLEDTLWKLTNQALSFRHLRMAYQRDLHLLRTKLKGLLIEVEDHMRFREGSGSSAQRLLRSTKEVEELISKVSKSDTDVNIFDGDIYMEEETRQLLRQKEEEMKGIFKVERDRFELKLKTLMLENRAYKKQVDELSDRNHLLDMKVQYLETHVTKLSKGQRGQGATAALSTISLGSLLAEFKAHNEPMVLDGAAEDGGSGSSENDVVVAVNQGELNKVQASFLKLKRQNRLYTDLIAQAKSKLLQGIALAEKNGKALSPGSSRRGSGAGQTARRRASVRRASIRIDPNSDLAIAERVLSECAKGFHSMMEEMNQEDEACAAATGNKPKPVRLTKIDELEQEISVLTTANQVLQRRLSEQAKSIEEAQREKASTATSLAKMEADFVARMEDIKTLKLQIREKDTNCAKMEEKMKEAEAALQDEKRFQTSNAIRLRRAEEAQDKERSRYADDSARKRQMLAERDRRISMQEDEIQKLQDKMGTQEQRLGELKSERKNLADTLERARTQLHKANEAAEPKVKVMGRGRSSSKPDAGAVDGQSESQELKGGQVRLLRRLCRTMDLPEIVDELQHKIAFDSPVDLSQLVVRIKAKLKAKITKETHAEWAEKFQELEVQSATSYNARLKRERCIMWRSLIRSHSVHGAREIEEVMDSNKSNARYSRTRTGRLRKRPRKNDPKGELQTMSEPSGSEGEDDEDSLFDKADFGSKYGRLTDYIQARAITWQEAIRAEGDAKKRASNLNHIQRSTTMMEVEFFKEKQKSLEKTIEGMKFDIELKDYELRKIREAWIEANDNCLVYKNAYDMEFRKVAALTGEIEELHSADQEAAKAAVIDAMQNDEAFAQAVAERSIEARENMVQFSDEVERSAAELANRRHAMRKIGATWKAETLDWTEFDFAGALDEDQAVIAGIEATAGEEGVDEELKAEASLKKIGSRKQDRSAKYGEKMQKAEGASSSASSSSSSSSSEEEDSSEEEAVGSRRPSHDRRASWKPHLPVGRRASHGRSSVLYSARASIKKVQMTNRLIKSINPQSREVFWEDAGARARQRRMSVIRAQAGEDNRASERRESAMLMELGRLREEVKLYREGSSSRRGSSRRPSAAQEDAEKNAARMDELTRQLAELKVQNEVLQTVQAAAKRHSPDEAANQEAMRRLLRQATGGLHPASPSKLKKISLHQFIADEEAKDRAEDRRRDLERRALATTPILHKTVKIAGTGSSDDDKSKAESSARPAPAVAAPKRGQSFVSKEALAAYERIKTGAQETSPVANDNPGAPSSMSGQPTVVPEATLEDPTGGNQSIHPIEKKTAAKQRRRRRKRVPRVKSNALQEQERHDTPLAEDNAIEAGDGQQGEGDGETQAPDVTENLVEELAESDYTDGSSFYSESDDEPVHDKAETQQVFKEAKGDGNPREDPGMPNTAQSKTEGQLGSPTIAGYEKGQKGNTATEAHPEREPEGSSQGTEESSVESSGSELEMPEPDGKSGHGNLMVVEICYRISSRKNSRDETANQGDISSTVIAAASHADEIRRAALSNSKRATSILAQQRSTLRSHDPGAVDIHNLREIYGASRGSKKHTGQKSVDSACQTDASVSGIEAAMDIMPQQIRMLFGELVEVSKIAGRAKIQIRVRPERTSHQTQTAGGFRCIRALTKPLAEPSRNKDDQTNEEETHWPGALGNLTEEVVAWLKISLVQFQHAKLHHIEDSAWQLSPLPFDSDIDTRRLLEDFVSFLDRVLLVKWPGRQEHQLGLRAVYRRSAEELAEVAQKILLNGVGRLTRDMLVQHTLGLGLPKGALMCLKGTPPLQRHYVKTVMEPLVLGVGVMDELRNALQDKEMPTEVKPSIAVRMVDAFGGGFKLNIKCQKRNRSSIGNDSTAGETTGSDNEKDERERAPSMSVTFITAPESLPPQKKRRHMKKVDKFIRAIGGGRQVEKLVEELTENSSPRTILPALTAETESRGQAELAWRPDQNRIAFASIMAPGLPPPERPPTLVRRKRRYRRPRQASPVRVDLEAEREEIQRTVGSVGWSYTRRARAE